MQEGNYPSTMYFYSSHLQKKNHCFNSASPANCSHDFRKHSASHSRCIWSTFHTSNHCFNCASPANCPHDFGKHSASHSCCIWSTFHASNHCFNCASPVNCSHDFRKHSAGHFCCLRSTFHTSSHCFTTSSCLTFVWDSQLSYPMYYRVEFSSEFQLVHIVGSVG